MKKSRCVVPKDHLFTSLKAFPCLPKMVEYTLPCIFRMPDDYFALILLNLITVYLRQFLMPSLH